MPAHQLGGKNECATAAEEAARLTWASGGVHGGPNAQVQGRPLGVAEAIVCISVPCNAQLGRCK